ncbi:MAG TPA: T9SS type A sorting domain-containing protein, partial [Caldithrix sp.]|nr:T9SS type A sorting domain-containing protein [Caldithrix sp.]
GSTWGEISTPENSAVFDLTFCDPQNGYAVGDSGAILKYDFLSNANTQNKPAAQLSRFQLEQNYPNPFNSRTTIRFQIPAEGFVQLKILDMFGRQIALLINEKRTAGSHRVDFVAKSLPSGYYFYSLTFSPEKNTGSFTRIRKMLLVK